MQSGSTTDSSLSKNMFLKYAKKTKSYSIIPSLLYIFPSKEIYDFKSFNDKGCYRTEQLPLVAML